MAFLLSEYKPTLKTASERNAFKPENVLTALTPSLLIKLIKDFSSWTPDRSTMSEEEVKLLDAGLGPPKHIGRYTDGILNVAGIEFRTTSAKAVMDKSIASAAFMAVRTVDSECTFFGVMRDILKIPKPGDNLDGECDEMVNADFFNSSATERAPLANTHLELQVPTVTKGFLTSKHFGAGNLWPIRSIVPVNITLIQNPDSPSELLVLSRDARLRELAHPAWGPNAHLHADLSVEWGYALQRIQLNSNLEGLQRGDDEEEEQAEEEQGEGDEDEEDEDDD
ncbi:hypothetical protein CEUSTIGMA_g13591.t1 [Chlamydomonas eustigma]|uniref:Uncharacterized protein n=1 Tax=Chlamydomonas eustigma TaxID=1157962 RepID=A0A250XSZ5_9CHLO|nr:hypothetical protein CEUSTIGMA_g13591.t1 [Chlamydomonas eustigma]|eukprot:GAX86178.1 hypothetical protein CEUSTIGMA_g13591.t1 [Chlamydomonas eustigma]